MIQTCYLRIACLMVLTHCGVIPALADQSLQQARREYRTADEKGILSLAWENDRWAGTDQHYTNGFRLAYLSPESAVPRWLDAAADWLPMFPKHSRRRYSLALGQSMFTPKDITRRGLIVNDRPYAGWLYGNIGLISDTDQRLDTLEFSMGVVGESALAEPVQETVHQWTDSPDPAGWDNQLQDEPAIMATYERRWRNLYQFEPFGLGADLSPHIGGSAGTVFTQAAAGATLRLGFDLPADYGPPRIRPSLPGSDFFIPTRELSGYVFAGVEGRAVAHNIFLDGNLFHDSHSVDKKPLVGSLQLGAVFTWQTMRLSYTHVFMTREFDAQDSGDQFGAITLSLRF